MITIKLKGGFKEISLNQEKEAKKEKVRITKKDVDQMGRDELEVLVNDIEDGVYEDYKKYDFEDGLYSYAIDKLFRMDFED